MLTYILITAIINVIFCRYLLNDIQQEQVVACANNKGIFVFYLLAALTGCAVIPIYVAMIFYVLFIEK